MWTSCAPAAIGRTGWSRSRLKRDALADPQRLRAILAQPPLWKDSPSTSVQAAECGTAQADAPFPSIASNTGARSPGEELMTRSTSAVAVCCSNASRVSVMSRAFSIAMTACAAKFCSSAICLSVNGRTSGDTAGMRRAGAVLAQRNRHRGAGATEIDERTTRRRARSVDLVSRRHRRRAPRLHRPADRPTSANSTRDRAA